MRPDRLSQLLVVVGLAGCGGKSGPPRRLFTDAEIATLRGEVTARVADNAKRVCPAPQVVPIPTDGPSGPDLVTLVEHSACRDEILHIKDTNYAALATACQVPLEAQIHAAAAHATGCSPYQIDATAKIPEFMAFLGIVKVVAPAASVQTDLELLRVSQDLWRGHASLIAAMIAVAATEMIAPKFEAALATLPKAQLPDVIAALERLIAGTPPMSDVLAGESDFVAVSSLQPSTGSGAHWGDPADELGAMLEATKLRDARMAKACPPNATLAVCRKGLEPPAELAKVHTLSETYADLGEGNAQAIRSQLVTILVEVGAPNFAPYAGRLAKGVARLAWLRLVAIALRDGTCPAGAMITGAPLGESLAMSEAMGTMTFALPAWMLGKSADPPFWAMKCAIVPTP